MDIVDICIYVACHRNGHETAKYGPYDAHIGGNRSSRSEYRSGYVEIDPRYPKTDEKIYQKIGYIYIYIYIYAYMQKHCKFTVNLSIYAKTLGIYSESDHDDQIHVDSLSSRT